MAGRFYLLGDAEGAIAGVGVSAARGLRVTQGPGPILHTNHALVADIVEDEDERALMDTYPSSRHRLRVLQQVASEASSRAHVVAALGNREGFPDSICKSPSATEATQTTFSIVAECGRGILQVCPGSPADHAYYPILLPA